MKKIFLKTQKMSGCLLKVNFCRPYIINQAIINPNMVIFRL